MPRGLRKPNGSANGALVDPDFASLDSVDCDALVGIDAVCLASFCPSVHANIMNVNTNKIYFFIFFFPLKKNQTNVTLTGNDLSRRLSLDRCFHDDFRVRIPSG